ncbi:bacteriohemerythrin [Derxia gummosa]|uniref:Bacteriohemerythrin n=1 Tax=Derxia gummosa DSM 723 TaxID=1121388 RepID=A0A8B6X247_9BURK|nr:hemerythrin family protein [Derxia gummosa]
MTEATLAKKPADAASGATLHDRILVGFKPIDDLHKEFEEIVGVLNDPAEADFGEHLLALHEHMLRHAAVEEGFMAQERYPHLGRHRRAHEHLLEAIARVRDRWDCGDVEAVRRFAAELMGWFAIHASSEDAELVAYLKGAPKAA